MNFSSVEDAKNFCAQCNWTYSCWVIHRNLFDDNPNINILNHLAPGFHEHLWYVSLEYSYLQICKLHDPSTSSRKKTTSYNLTIPYIIENFQWDNEQEKISHIAKKLNKLYSLLKPARDKVISHTDRDAFAENKQIGLFPEGLDLEYFQLLQDFVSCVYEKWVGGPYLFKDMNLAKADALEYLKLLQAQFK